MAGPARETFRMRVTSSVRVKGPVITDTVSAAVAATVQTTVMGRIGNARNLMDGSAKPLTAKYAKWKSTSTKYYRTFTYMRPWTKAYARYKATGELRTPRGKMRKSLWTKPIVNQRLGRGIGRPVRDLRLSGEMLDNLTIRKATPKQVVLALTGRGPRMKAMRNAHIEEWLGYSPNNERSVVKEASEQIVGRLSEIVVAHKP